MAIRRFLTPVRSGRRLRCSGICSPTTSRCRAPHLNAPVDGVRPDPQFANVIEAVSGGKSQAHSLDSSVTLSLAGLGTNYHVSRQRASNSAEPRSS